MKHLLTSIKDIIRILTICYILFAFIDYSEATVGPNGQPGRCGPYYLWYQTGPGMYSQPGDYIDLCEITFDISDIVDDFDFVYFIDTPGLQRASLDKDQDGVSDRYFWGVEQNLLRWKPAHGCVRITAWECWGHTFNANCGYAMINIQPKPNFHSGSANIPVIMRAKCPPYGFDCSETAIISHQYSNCFTPSLPKFIVHISASPLVVYTQEIRYTIVIQNTQEENDNIILTDTLSTGTNNGILTLSEINVTCATGATCTILGITNNQIKISLTNLSKNDSILISYARKPDNSEIPRTEVSYFTDTVTLTNSISGEVINSAQVIVGIRGAIEPARRPERPRSVKAQ